MGTETTQPEETQEVAQTEETPAVAEETQEAATEAPAEGTDAEMEAAREGEPDEEDADEEQTDGGGKKPSEGQRRGRKPGYVRKLERQERLIEELTNQLAVNRQGQPHQQGQPQEVPPEEKAAQYLDNLVEQRIAAREARAEQQRQAAELQAKEQEFRAAHDDYDDALDAFARAGLPPATVQAVLTSGAPPAIMYSLAKNPAELARIRALPPVQAILEIGRLDAKRASSTATQKAPPGKQPVVTRKPAAPAPIAPVTARGPTTVKSVSQMSQEEYNAWRDSQRKR